MLETYSELESLIHIIEASINPTQAAYFANKLKENEQQKKKHTPLNI